MATVTFFLPQCPRYLICKKGGLHQNQPLNMVCLDKLCRNNPLSCSICFSQTHKYHKVVGLNKFIDDYQRNAKSPNEKMLVNKISKHYGMIKQSMEEFRAKVNSEIDRFMKYVDRYAQFLFSHAKVRSQVSHLTGLKLQPSQLPNMQSQEQLQDSLKFILNNSLYDDNLNMINLAQILKQDKDKVFALIDKMDYMTSYSQQVISEAMKTLNFAESTIKAESASFNDSIEKIWKSKPNPQNTVHFNEEKIKLAKIIQDQTKLILDPEQNPQNIPQFPSPDTDFRFSKYKHHMLNLKNNGNIVVSDITALKPQFAIAWPNLNCEPQKKKQWSVRINNCRNFASANTMALGVGKISDIKLANFEDDPTNTLLVTSQGYTLLNGVKEKTDFIYGKGDVLHFKYDPFYAILEIKKQNGRKLTLKALDNNTEPLYICARLTYASDEVEIV